MKKILLTFTFIISVAGAYYLGVNVGMGHMWAHVHSLQANAAWNNIKVPPIKIKGIETCEGSRIHENEMEIRTSLLAYMKYLDHWSSKFPTFTVHDKATRDWYKRPAEYLYKISDDQQRQVYGPAFKDIGVTNEQ